MLIVWYAARGLVLLAGVAAVLLSAACCVAAFRKTWPGVSVNASRSLVVTLLGVAFAVVAVVSTSFVPQATFVELADGPLSEHASVRAYFLGDTISWSMNCLVLPVFLSPAMAVLWLVGRRKAKTAAGAT